jgi:hypothetical protein
LAEALGFEPLPEHIELLTMSAAWVTRERLERIKQAT